MKLNRIFVAIENKSGRCYQVPLNKSQQDLVIDLIRQMQGGEIKACKPKLPFTLGKTETK